MLAATGIRPAPTHAVSAVRDHSRPKRKDAPGSDHLRIRAKYRFGTLVRQARASKCGIPPSNPDTPCRRPVNACQGFHDVIERQRLNLQAPEGAGRVHPKNARFGQRSDDGLREVARLFGLIGMFSNEWFERADGVEQHVTRMGCHVCHRAPPVRS